MTDEAKKEFTLRISQANKSQMVVIIYEILLEHLQDAQAAVLAGDKGSKRESINKIRGCINELVGSLHYEYEPAGELLELYVYCSKELVNADLHDSEASLQHIEQVITSLKEAYAVVAEQDNSPAVMGNTQAVYAGLTYGKNTLTENVSDPSGNRGFLA